MFITILIVSFVGAILCWMAMVGRLSGKRAKTAIILLVLVNWMLVGLYAKRTIKDVVTLIQKSKVP